MHTMTIGILQNYNDLDSSLKLDELTQNEKFRYNSRLQLGGSKDVDFKNHRCMLSTF